LKSCSIARGYQLVIYSIEKQYMLLSFIIFLGIEEYNYNIVGVFCTGKKYGGQDHAFQF
jgi:hypothetical protein